MTETATLRPLLLTLRQVIALTGLSKATIYRFEAAGDFPTRRKIGNRNVRWVTTEVEEWFEALIQLGT